MKSIFKFIVTYILTIEAKLVLWKYKPKIVAVTGSVGKTSTKDAIYTVLKHHKKVRRSQKSFNSEIGNGNKRTVRPIADAMRFNK